MAIAAEKILNRKSGGLGSPIGATQATEAVEGENFLTGQALTGLDRWGMAFQGTSTASGVAAVGVGIAGIDSPLDFSGWFGRTAAEGTTGSLDTIPESSRIQPYYPPYNGFAEVPATRTLRPGAIFDRYGLDTGRFASPVGTPIFMRSLPPGASEAPYSMSRVVKPIDVQSGTVAPWFQQPGGGAQYQFPQSIQSLIKNGYIERVGG